MEASCRSCGESKRQSAFGRNQWGRARNGKGGDSLRKGKGRRGRHAEGAALAGGGRSMICTISLYSRSLSSSPLSFSAAKNAFISANLAA